MITLGTTGLVGYLATGGKKSTDQPPINAKSKEEESFVQYVTPRCFPSDDASYPYLHMSLPETT
jgi:hypothetical protein